MYIYRTLAFKNVYICYKQFTSSQKLETGDFHSLKISGNAKYTTTFFWVKLLNINSYEHQGF